MRTLSVGLLTILQAVVILGVLSWTYSGAAERPGTDVVHNSDPSGPLADFTEDLSRRTP